MIEKLELRVAKLENQLYITKKVLSFEEASKFLNLSKSYLYQLTSKTLIPHYKPQGKMLYFEREELEKWLMKNPVKSRQELKDEASDKFLYSNKKKSRQ